MFYEAEQHMIWWSRVDIVTVDGIVCQGSDDT